MIYLTQCGNERGEISPIIVASRRLSEASRLYSELAHQQLEEAGFLCAVFSKLPERFFIRCHARKDTGMMFLNSQRVEFRPWVLRVLRLFVRPEQPTEFLKSFDDYAYGLAPSVSKAKAEDSRLGYDPSITMTDWYDDAGMKCRSAEYRSEQPFVSLPAGWGNLRQEVVQVAPRLSRHSYLNPQGEAVCIVYRVHVSAMLADVLHIDQTQ